MWGDIPVTRLHIPPRPEAVVSCGRDKSVSPFNDCLKPFLKVLSIIIVIKSKDDISQSFNSPHAQGPGWKILDKLKLIYI